MAIRLTDTAISKAVRELEGRRDLMDAGCPGLRLRLTPAGSKTWALACRDRLGRMRRFPLGSYPTMGISDARDAARALRPKVKHEGVDPIADRRRERAMGEAAKAGVGTLAALLDTYTEKRGKTLKSWAEAHKRIKLIFKPLLGLPVGTLAARDFQMLADAYPAVMSAAFAVRSVRPALRWAAQHHYVSEELARLHPPATVQRRKRVLSDEELRALLPALAASKQPCADALRFMLLTVARRQEVASARWRDINLTTGTWTIPETKNGEPHIVPLPRQAIDLIRARMRETPKADGLIFATKSGGALGNWDRQTKAIQAESGTADWTRHDLRRTGATKLGELGELPDIIEAALNHTSIRSPLASLYNRSRYRPQVAVALQRLADALDGIATGGAEVVPLHRA